MIEDHISTEVDTNINQTPEELEQEINAEQTSSNLQDQADTPEVNSSYLLSQTK